MVKEIVLDGKQQIIGEEEVLNIQNVLINKGCFTQTLFCANVTCEDLKRAIVQLCEGLPSEIKDIQSMQDNLCKSTRKLKRKFVKRVEERNCHEISYFNKRNINEMKAWVRDDSKNMTSFNDILRMPIDWIKEAIIADTNKAILQYLAKMNENFKLLILETISDLIPEITEKDFSFEKIPWSPEDSFMMQFNEEKPNYFIAIYYQPTEGSEIYRLALNEGDDRLNFIKADYQKFTLYQFIDALLQVGKLDNDGVSCSVLLSSMSEYIFGKEIIFANVCILKYLYFLGNIYIGLYPHGCVADAFFMSHNNPIIEKQEISRLEDGNFFIKATLTPVLLDSYVKFKCEPFYRRQLESYSDKEKAIIWYFMAKRYSEYDLFSRKSGEKLSGNQSESKEQTYEIYPSEDIKYFGKDNFISEELMEECVSRMAEEGLIISEAAVNNNFYTVKFAPVTGKELKSLDSTLLPDKM